MLLNFEVFLSNPSSRFRSPDLFPDPELVVAPAVSTFPATRYFWKESSIRRSVSLAESRSGKFYWRRELGSTVSEDEPQTSGDVLQQQKQDSIPKNPEEQARPGIQESRLIIGIPTCNEEDSIARTIVKLSGIGEIVICDDGSTDATVDIARALRCKVIRHPRKLGRSDCITSLFLAARKLKANEMITLGTDTCYKIEDLESLLEAVRSGDSDMAIGSRIIDSVRDSGAAGGLSDPESLLTVYGKKSSCDDSTCGHDECCNGKRYLGVRRPAGTQGQRISEDRRCRISQGNSEGKKHRTDP